MECKIHGIQREFSIGHCRISKWHAIDGKSINLENFGAHPRESMKYHILTHSLRIKKLDNEDIYYFFSTFLKNYISFITFKINGLVP